MILHYLKIAWRNLLKYRTQTVVSILGLAVGFACFALSTIWIRYELTFDAFQPEAGRTYVVFRKMSSSSSVMGMSGALSYNNLQALRNKVPEVEAAGCLFQHNMEVTLRYADANLGSMQMLLVDSGFVRMFGIELLRGDYTFKTPRDNRWGYGLAGGGGIAFLIDRFELNFRVRYYFGYADILRNRNRYADSGIDGSENPFAQTPMRSPLDNLMISVGVNFRFNREGFETWKPRPKRAKAPEAFTYGK